MVHSVIDIGTNTILLLIAQKSYDSDFNVLHDEHNISRLGSGIVKKGEISKDAFDRVENFLKRYIFLSEQFNVDKIISVGTSGLRSATNRNQFLIEMKNRTGLDISILSGLEEAEGSYIGGLYDLNVKEDYRVLIDIGGGSTEVVYGFGNKIIDKISIEIGAVKIKEKFYIEQPIDKKVIDQARYFIREKFSEIFDIPGNPTFVGVAGTVTTLGEMEHTTNKNIPKEVNGKILTIENVRNLSFILNLLDINRIKKIPQVNPERADLLPAGSLILEEYMNKFEINELVVSTSGLRYGVMKNSFMNFT